jgi:hypothetical protein
MSDQLSGDQAIVVTGSEIASEGVADVDFVTS